MISISLLQLHLVLIMCFAVCFDQCHTLDLKWYQCIEHPDHCCERTNTFCRPNCAGGCYLKEILDNDQYYTDGNANFRFPAWMSQLPDSLRLTEMSIPGTHDTASRKTNFLAECQSMTVTEQLVAGIRALDVRCRHIKDRFTMHHDRVFLNLAFEDVLNMSSEFLRNNPREMIIMRIKNEWNEESTTRSFQDTLQYYIDNKLWSSFIDTRSQLGTLGDHRGKILLLNDHNCDFGQFGYCWSSSEQYTQDFYNLPFVPPFPQTQAQWKVEKVKQNLEASSNDNEHLYINFSSAQLALITPPKALARGNMVKGVNELAVRLLTGNTKYKKTGLFFMDFPGSALIYQILLRN